MIRTVLVPLDGSAFGEQALPHAALIAQQADAQLHFVHVLVPLVVGDPMMQYTMVDVETPDEAGAYLTDVLKRFPSTKPEKAPVAGILDGPVTEAIQQYARTHNADLIVMTTHGRSPLARAWMGSVTDEVIRGTTVPLLLIRAREDGQAPPLDVAGLRHVLIAIDGTPDSEAVLSPAAELARLFGSAVTLLRVILPRSPQPVERPAQPPPVSEFHLGEESHPTPEEELDRLAKVIRSHGLTVQERIVEHNHPERAILDQAKQLGCDLIAMETHARSGLSRLILGSVADKVIRGAECAVLIHHATHPTDKGAKS